MNCVRRSLKRLPEPIAAYDTAVNRLSVGCSFVYIPIAKNL